MPEAEYNLPLDSLAAQPDYDTPPDRVDPATVEAAQKYMDKMLGTPEDRARRERAHRLSILSGQLGHPMSPSDIEGHQAADRGAAVDAENQSYQDAPPMDPRNGPAPQEAPPSAAPQAQRVVGKPAYQRQEAARPAIDPQQAFMMQAAPVATHLVMRYGIDAASAAVIAAQLMAPNDPRRQVGAQVHTALQAVLGLPAQLPGAVSGVAKKMRTNVGQ